MPYTPVYFKVKIELNSSLFTYWNRSLTRRPRAWWSVSGRNPAVSVLLVIWVLVAPPRNGLACHHVRDELLARQPRAGERVGLVGAQPRLDRPALVPTVGDQSLYGQDLATYNIT